MFKIKFIFLIELILTFSMKLQFLLNEIQIFFYITALYNAVKEGNVEIVKLLLINPKIDINAQNISNVKY